MLQVFASTSVTSLQLISYCTHQLKVTLQVKITCTKPEYIDFPTLLPIYFKYTLFRATTHFSC